MRHGVLRKGPAVASLLAVLLAQAAAAGQTAPARGVSKEDAAAARAAAEAFSERMLATHDFAAVTRGLFAEDFMTRRLAAEAAARDAGGDFMLAGVPSLTFDRALAARAPAADWTRVYVAAANLMHFVFHTALAGRGLREFGDPDRGGGPAFLDVFPPEAFRALDASPAASNFLRMKRGEVVVRTPPELRALAAALEEAVRLTRPRFTEALAKGRSLEANLRLMREAAARDEVGPADGEAEDAGRAKGARLLRVFAPSGYSLLLAVEGGAMKVLWANLPSD